jgi:hypothetical protein
LGRKGLVAVLVIQGMESFLWVEICRLKSMWSIPRVEITYDACRVVDCLV